MSRWPSYLFTEQAKNRLSRESIRAALHAAHVSQDQGLPAILTLNHLARHVDVSHRYLRELVERQRDPYRSFSSKKRRGGFRTICVPEPKLMRTQRWIVKNILNRCQPDPASYAYQRRKSLLDCANVHAGANWLIKVDVRQFFESITEIQAYRIFSGLGYGNLISFEMARLVTRSLPSASLRKRQPQWRVEQLERYIIRWYEKDSLGYLPQGAPTSPMLSNLAMRAFDADIRNLAEHYELSYTRYSDDLIFSNMADGFSRAKAVRFIRAVFRRMNGEGLRPHQSKTIISPPGARKVVLGLLVDTDRPRLRREFRRMLECHIHFVRKRGPIKHAQARGFDSVLGFRRHLEGLLTYAAYVDPEFANGLRNEIRNVEWPA